MSNDEQPDSLAAQAAAWVPPWERPQRPPDRAYQAEVQSFVRELRRGCQSIDIDYVPLRTDQDLDGPLSSYLASRATRVR